MDPLETFKRALDQTSKIVAAVSPEHYTQPTPCAEFDVKALTNHLVGAVQMFVAGARDEQFDAAKFGEDLIGDSPATAYDQAAGELRTALAKPGVLEQTWKLPFGAMPGTFALGIGTVEVLQHGWDLARATGQQADFDPELSEAALARAKTMPADQTRQPGIFGPEVEAPADAPPHDRLAAFLGRSL